MVHSEHTTGARMSGMTKASPLGLKIRDNYSEIADLYKGSISQVDIAKILRHRVMEGSHPADPDLEENILNVSDTVLRTAVRFALCGFPKGYRIHDEYLGLLTEDEQRVRRKAHLKLGGSETGRKAWEQGLGWFSEEKLERDAINLLIQPEEVGHADPVLIAALYFTDPGDIPLPVNAIAYFAGIDRHTVRTSILKAIEKFAIYSEEERVAEIKLRNIYKHHTTGALVWTDDRVSRLEKLVEDPENIYLEGNHKGDYNWPKIIRQFNEEEPEDSPAKKSQLSHGYRSRVKPRIKQKLAASITKELGLDLDPEDALRLIESYNSKVQNK